MKLLTHNFLSSKFLKGVVTGYPLILNAVNIKVGGLLFLEKIQHYLQTGL